MDGAGVEGGFEGGGDAEVHVVDEMGERGGVGEWEVDEWVG